ncbi:MAG TPA: hypothetical protein VNL13_06590 [Sulfolobales archaeon]|nr:hypothetical protein [Sulfolobales archaeon]
MGSRYQYKVVYLLPQELRDREPFLKLQFDNIKTYIDNVVIPFICDPDERDRRARAISEFERVLSGLRNTVNVGDENVLGKVASLWYVFTKTSHASIGPRVGSFTEGLLTKWFEDASWTVYRDEQIGEFFSRELKIEDQTIKRSKARIDFILTKDNTIVFMELRESEHTGGRTGQESLLDKFKDILDWLEKHNLRGILLRNNINELRMVIAILFTEKGYELVSERNYSKGRLTSLINYILRKDSIFGRIVELVNRHGYSLSNYKGNMFRSTDEDSLTSFIRNNLTDVRSRRIMLSIDGVDRTFNVKFEILWGNELFQSFMNRNFEDLLKRSTTVIADDLWLMFTVALNELKVLYSLGDMNVLKVYRVLGRHGFYQKLDTLKSSRTFDDYIRILNSIVDDASNLTLESLRELRLLETNDMVKQYEYLRQLCLASFIMYKSGQCDGERSVG